jgi:CheY-like chemotaxis protein
MLKRLAKEGLQFPILVVSAFQQGLDSLREQHRAQPHGLRGFLDKPFKLEELRAEIKRLISSGPEARK